VKDVSALLQSEDPFSLLFGFEMCRSLLRRDAAFAKLGSSFLEKLLLEPTRSRARCDVFSAVALIASVHVRAAAEAGRAPLFWVRLAALTHAGVLTDALAGIQDGAGFFKWASVNFYPSYHWHGVVDRREAPRWNPDWISPDFLFAELVGRVNGAVHMLAESDRPSRWVSLLKAAFAKLNESRRGAAAYFHGPMDDFREGTIPSTAHPVFMEVERDLHEAAKLSDVPGIFGLANTVQPSAQALDDILKLLSSPVGEAVAAGQPELPYLRVCAHIAAVCRFEPIAQAVINRCFFKVRDRKTDEPVTDIFTVLVEACACRGDADKYRELLGNVVARFCFGVSPGEDLANVEAAIEVLGKRDERLMSALSRARATARTRRGRAN
jgi:hypothetical protein